MKFKTIAAGALLAAASFAASAATFNLTLDANNSATFGNTATTIGSFSDDFLFTISPLTVGEPLANVASGKVKVASIFKTAVAFDATTPIQFFKVESNGSHTILATQGDADASYLLSSLSAGNYGFTVAGHTLQANTAGKYSGNFSLEVTPVPEPETYGMLLGGLALLGAVARRKAKKAA